MHRDSMPTHDSATDMVCCRAPGTCGELIQGCIDGNDFLVNCPIDMYAQATVYTHPQVGLHLHDAESFRKIEQAVRLICEKCNMEPHHEIEIDSLIPRGKGMASSTADMTAAIEAFCSSCGLILSDRQFAGVLAAIEPSDCVHFRGIAQVNHLTGELIEMLPAPVGMRVLVIDCGGEVDTLSFDRERARAVYRKNRTTIASALQLLKLGLRNGDAHAVGTAATLSAQLSQQILHKPQFDELLSRSLALGALGVNCAHSGTVLGLMYEEGAPGDPGQRLVGMVNEFFGGDIHIVGDHRIISGGRHANA